MTQTGTTQATKPVRTLRRSTDNRMLAGVCGGAADYLGVDATVVRLVLVAATLFGFGLGAVLYVACWLIVPEDTAARA